MITLRDNQHEPINKAVAFFNEKKPKPSLIVLPTAWGKSILTAEVARRCEDKLIVIQPSKELLEQNYSKYVNLCCDSVFVNAGIYSASFGLREIKQITYATIGSIKRLGAEFKALGYKKVLIDEAHLFPRESTGMLRTFLKEAGITHVLGITATPIKLQSNTDFFGERISKLVMLTSRSAKGNLFKEILHVGQVREMVEMGFWSRLRYSAHEFDDSELVFNSSKSEYTEESVQRAHEENGGSKSVIEALENNADRRHILVFVPSVAEAIKLSTEYPNSAAIYGDMDKKDRARVIAQFRAGEIRVIFNVRVLSTGFDYTGIDCIILAISTASIALYYQIIGRATRIDKDKEDALIVDLGGNVDRFGHVEDIHFEQGKIWRMFGTGGRLLSGIPIHEIGNYTKEDVQKVEQGSEDTMPFGKYKGEKIANIPLNYRQWMIRSFDWNAKNESLRKAILATMQ